ncbi:MAG TPA: LytR C-terminal domain-containing protein, partial [Patescibacteria group bacterium]|nr:LytR C-terminal domain-containing protein [Patescibacteria group bacterium]
MKAIFFLTNSQLSIQTEKAVIKKIAFPKEMTPHDAPIDTESLCSYLTKELASVAKKVSPGVVILGSGVLAQVVVPKGGELENVKKELLDKLTFSKESLAEKTIETKTKTYILAANKAIFQTVVDACKANNIDIKAVVPFSLFTDLDAEESLTRKDIKEMLKSEDIYPIGNFLSETSTPDTTEEKSPSPEPEPESSGDAIEKEQEEEKKEEVKEDKEAPQESSSEDTAASSAAIYSKRTVWNSSRLLVVLGFLIILTVLMGGLIYFQYYRTNKSGPTLHMISTRPTPTSAPTPTATPTPVQTAKEDLTVSILNGTGTPGQAGEVKDILANNGYK